jgi:CubicO group peptidase (beta-lactamase class C family)
MKKNFLTIVLLLFNFFSAKSQSLKAFADSIRNAYHIPELAYAVVSADTIYEMQALGYKKINSDRQAALSDKFRIGSNTKAVTGFIAALLVKQGKISWDTKFFDLFPELKAGSRPGYRELTLLKLLSFRTKLYSYTYTYAQPVKGQFKGTEEQQRYQFAAWFFKRPPAAGNDSIHFSNLSYVAAGLMLEKVSGKTYKQLVKELGTQLGIDFSFGQPNMLDGNQPWGHDANLKPEAPADNYKLNWLLPAGNITLNLPDYAKFIQLQLQGLKGASKLLTAEEFYFLHYGLPRFAIGWFWNMDENNQKYSHNTGNPGTFLTEVYVYKDLDKAFILFSNAQTDEAEEGLDVLYRELKIEYGNNF